MSFKKASVSAIDAGGSNGTCGSNGREELAWLCCSVSTLESCLSPEDSSGTTEKRGVVGVVVLVGV